MIGMAKRFLRLFFGFLDRKQVKRKLEKKNIPILLALLFVFYVAITGT